MPTIAKRLPAKYLVNSASLRQCFSREPHIASCAEGALPKSYNARTILEKSSDRIAPAIQRDRHNVLSFVRIRTYCNITGIIILHLSDCHLRPLLWPLFCPRPRRGFFRDKHQAIETAEVPACLSLTKSTSDLRIIAQASR